MSGKTPYEAWFGHKPNISHFRIFGSRAWARIPPEKRKDLKHKINGCIKNRDLHKSKDGKTPSKDWFSHNPNISHFRIFGSRAWARIPSKKRKGLQLQRK